VAAQPKGFPCREIRCEYAVSVAASWITFFLDGSKGSRIGVRSQENCSLSLVSAENAKLINHGTLAFLQPEADAITWIW